MKIKAGVVCMLIGAVLILSAFLLYVNNNNEDKSAGESSAVILEEVVAAVESRRNETEPSDTAKNDMTVTVIGEHSYIGYIYIPVLEDLELPVMADWSYEGLKKSPCRYSGSTLTDDLVLLGHNYTRHFGKLSRLIAGDIVYFTDMDGVTHQYHVIATDILASTAIEEMTAGEYDLSLFTCDYSARNRLTVRCDRSE